MPTDDAENNYRLLSLVVLSRADWSNKKMNVPALYDAVGDCVVLSPSCIHSSAFPSI